MHQLSETVERKFIEVIETDEWEIWTDSGWHDIKSTNKTVKYEVYEVTTHTGRSIKCADTHILFKHDLSEIFAKDCFNQIILTEDGPEVVVFVVATGVFENMYDLSVDSEDHRYYTNGFLSHNSTIVAGYVAWYALFNSNKNAVILANKQSSSKEIFSRAQMILENCPKWLQQGVKTWNKTSLELENGTRVSCGATTPSSGRSGSISLLILDEFAFVSPTVAEEFMASVFPTISSSESSKLIIVSTPNGMNHFYKLWIEAEQGINGFIPLVGHWSEHPKRNQAWADDQRAILKDIKFFQEVEAQFQGSSNTLIKGEKIAALPMKQPIHTSLDSFVCYEAPVPKKSYVMTVDVAKGEDQDSSAFVIFDISQLPYKVVATFKNSSINTLTYPEIILHYAKMYNEAFVLVEINSLGQQVADSLYFDLEYENMYMSTSSKKGDDIIDGFGTSIRAGFETTKKSKLIGCNAIKLIVELDNLEVNSADIISEMSTFIRSGSSWKAEEGKHDDLMMCLVTFGFLTQTTAFKNLFDFSLRQEFIKTQLKQVQDNELPMGYFFDGRDDENELNILLRI